MLSMVRVVRDFLIGQVNGKKQQMEIKKKSYAECPLYTKLDNADERKV